MSPLEDQRERAVGDEAPVGQIDVGPGDEDRAVADADAGVQVAPEVGHAGDNRVGVLVPGLQLGLEVRPGVGIESGSRPRAPGAASRPASGPARSAPAAASVGTRAWRRSGPPRSRGRQRPRPGWRPRRRGPGGRCSSPRGGPTRRGPARPRRAPSPVPPRAFRGPRSAEVRIDEIAAELAAHPEAILRQEGVLDVQVRHPALGCRPRRPRPADRCPPRGRR